MLGWAIGFFVAALIAAVFGFGAIASAFSGIALLLFWIFLALFVLSLIAGALGARHGHAFSRGGRTLGLIAVTAAVAIFAYAWVQNDWTAESAGRAIDRNVAELADNTGAALETAGERTNALIEDASQNLRADAAGGIEEARNTVAPDEERETN